MCACGAVLRPSFVPTPKVVTFPLERDYTPRPSLGGEFDFWTVNPSMLTIQQDTKSLMGGSHLM